MKNIRNIIFVLGVLMSTLAYAHTQDTLVLLESQNIIIMPDSVEHADFSTMDNKKAYQGKEVVDQTTNTEFVGFKLKKLEEQHTLVFDPVQGKNIKTTESSEEIFFPWVFVIYIIILSALPIILLAGYDSILGVLIIFIYLAISYGIAVVFLNDPMQGQSRLFLQTIAFCFIILFFSYLSFSVIKKNMILIFSITLPVILALNFLINFRSAHAILFVVVGVAVGLIGFFIIKKAKEGLIEKEKQEQDPICIEDHAEQGPGAEY